MRVYLDHAATTPLRAEAREAWLAATDVVGNASSVHGAGQRARRMLEDSREEIAAVLGADPIEIVFTSGGTESINLALTGLWEARVEGRDVLVLPDGEHHATMDTAQWLEAARGARVRSVPLDPHGAVAVEAFAAALTDAAVATALLANNEIGTLSDVPALARASGEAGVPLHVDAVGAAGAVRIDFRSWRGDARGGAGLVALSLSGHKVGAPAGTGVLVASRHARLHPLLHGGGQQRGIRPGTQDVAGAAALAAALRAADADRDAESVRLTRLRDRLVAGIRSALPQTELLGDPVRRLPGNVHVLFPGAAGETLLFLLDVAGIDVSTGSACQAGVTEPSHVVRALGRSDRDARSVLRMTLGRTSTAADVDAVLAALPDAYARALASGARAAGGS